MALFRNISQQAEECDEIGVNAIRLSYVSLFLTVRAAHRRP